MYFREHNPPHFHAKYNEYEAQISIKDLRIMYGHLPPKALGLVMEWAGSHKKELLKNWDKIQKGQRWVKIEPLI